jgi:nucleotide-binding universal stress UspA family protein
MNYLVGLTALGGRDALSLGRMLARTGGITLTVCVVVPETWGHPSPARVDAEYAEFLDRYAEEAIAEARTFLEDEAPQAEYVSTSSHSATEELITTATKTGAPLVLLGSARHGPLGRFTIGGITGEMLHASPVPVAVAPRGYRPAPEARLQRVTCAFSGSTRSKTAFDAAVQLSRRHVVPLRLITLVVRDRQMYPSQVGYDAERLVAEQWRVQALEAQEKALATLPKDVEVESGVVDGHDWEHALDSVPWEEGEVLVVGSSRLGPVARVFLGSTSTKIIRSSPVPVVVIPRGTDVHLEDTGSISRVKSSGQHERSEF